MGNVKGPEYKDGKPTRLLLSLRAWGASSKADARAKAKAISKRNKESSKKKWVRIQNQRRIKWLKKVKQYLTKTEDAEM